MGNIGTYIGKWHTYPSVVNNVCPLPPTDYSFLAEHTDLRHIMGVGIAVTRGSAASLSFCYCLLLLTMSRNLLTKLKDFSIQQYIPIDSHIQFHKIAACTALFFSLIHTVGKLDFLRQKVVNFLLFFFFVVHQYRPIRKDKNTQYLNCRIFFFNCPEPSELYSTHWETNRLRPNWLNLLRKYIEVFLYFINL